MSERAQYRQNIIETFSHLERKVKYNSSMNLQDINITIEDTFCELLNNLYQDRTFRNLNVDAEGSYAAIDLGDSIGEIAFQVTSTTSRLKVKETIEKYKANKEFKTVVMLYCVNTKPTRSKDFSNEVNGEFKLEEWDLTDLLGKMPWTELNRLQKISNLLYRDIFIKIPSTLNLTDLTACDGWDKTIPTDFRDFTDKVKNVYPEIREVRLRKYCRDIASGEVELDSFSEREVSSMKYRIFDVCQDELIDFTEKKSSVQLNIDEINELIEKYTNRAVKIIEERSVDYNYPIKNKDTLRKIVLALINDCYLSFDEEGIYEN
ncbi:SMEK domain-containing protein [uncultured Draconibacterium sp.]|uniref:SMEK domain-containing protein n=1 Tax=uncultured Draconibacterium sp. TaxID=1573823 RepID=UPI0029C8D156|nr:SMEK domain-containing protein [uncultured Draconibacterium sp.]